MKKLFLIIAILFINSCSSNLSSSWSCPALKGGKGNCVSITEADQKISSISKTSTSSFADSKQEIVINLIAPKLDKITKKIPQTTCNNKDANNSPLKRLRTEEKVGRVWFAPYIDSEGYNHSESVIFVVDEESKWADQF